MKARIATLRRPLTVVLHLLFVLVSYHLAFLLRFEGSIPQRQFGVYLAALPWLLAVRGLTFWPFRLYHGLWRYAGLWDLQHIIGAVAISSGVFALIVRLTPGLEGFPRTVVVLDALILILLLGGARLARRAFREYDRLHAGKRVLIFGAGDAGELLVRDMRNNRFYNWEPIGFIDDDPAKIGQLIHGVRVLGTRADLPRLMAAEAPHEIVVAIPRAEAAEIRGIVQALEPFKTPIKTLPSLRDLPECKVHVGQIRNLSLEDLLSRKAIGLDAEPVRALVNGRRVLVTGAGGSIGSELSRQLAGFGPSQLIVLDRYENSLFDLGHDLASQHPGCACRSVIADIGDAARVDHVFARYQPEVVFHAAAHKHVPLMEMNPSEAIKNNVRGTRVLAEAAARHGAAEFVLISSDKAVNPSSVMGATKRVAEQIVRAANRPGGTRFMAVRFGNVLGSNGSVTRIFEAQIARGGPVTVTHPDIRRYFMLIPEAVQLVLHAAALRDPGTIYALEMGEQVRLQDFARNMIRLSGFVPDEEIEIQYIGLRPGEKLYEELVEEGEAAEPSDVDKILRVRSHGVAGETLRTRIAQLEAAADEGRDAAVVKLLSELVPTFRPGSAPVDEERTGSVIPMRRA